MQIALEKLPIQERLSLVRQVWDSIVLDVKNSPTNAPFNQQALQEISDNFSKLPTLPQKTQGETSPTFYAVWEKWHDENKAFLDDDTSWADVRDKNDTGRDVMFDD